jgi:hypothetical protein
MSNIHFIGDEKGDMGKSLVGRVLAKYMLDEQLPFLGFDTGRSHPALMRQQFGRDGQASAQRPGLTAAGASDAANRWSNRRLRARP